VRLHRRLADVQLAADLRVRLPARGQRQYLDLPARQRLLRRLAQPGHEAPGYRRGQHGLAAGRRPHRVRQLGRARVLQQVPGGARLDRVQDVGVGVVRGEHDDLRVRQLPDGRHAVAAGHPQVHQDHVELAGPGEGDRLRAGPGLAGHLDIRLRGEHAAQPRPDHGVVVGEHDPDACARRFARKLAHVGTSARTTVPSPGAERTVIVPPACRIRSRMPRSPYPPLTASGSNPRPSSATVSRTVSSP